MLVASRLLLGAGEGGGFLRLKSDGKGFPVTERSSAMVITPELPSAPSPRLPDCSHPFTIQTGAIFFATVMLDYCGPHMRAFYFVGLSKFRQVQRRRVLPTHLPVFSSVLFRLSCSKCFVLSVNLGHRCGKFSE